MRKRQNENLSNEAPWGLTMAIRLQAYRGAPSTTCTLGEVNGIFAVFVVLNVIRSSPTHCDRNFTNHFFKSSLNCATAVVIHLDTAAAGNYFCFGYKKN